MAEARMSFRRKSRLVTGAVFMSILISSHSEAYALGDTKGIARAGVYDHTEDRMLENIRYYIIENWLDTTGRGDFNHDKITNLTDFAIFTELSKASAILGNISRYISENWLESTGRGDFNYDSVTNFADLAILIRLSKTPKRPKPKPYVRRDIEGHPRDIPDAGAYEYRKDTAQEDIAHYIAENWLDKTGRGDFNHDGITDFADYAILARWWQNR